MLKKNIYISSYTQNRNLAIRILEWRALQLPT